MLQPGSYFGSVVHLFVSSDLTQQLPATRGLKIQKENAHDQSSDRKWFLSVLIFIDLFYCLQ